MSKNHSGESKIAVNRKARHDYTLEEQYEAGLALQGWEVKSMREKHAQISDAHVIVRKGEAWLLNSHIPPLPSASTHVIADPGRTRKLLLNRKELNKLMGHVEQKGYTIIPLELYWHQGRAKLKIALAKGKKLHDKRASEKDRDWQRQKERLFKHS